MLSIFCRRVKCDTEVRYSAQSHKASMHHSSFKIAPSVFTADILWLSDVLLPPTAIRWLSYNQVVEGPSCVIISCFMRLFLLKSRLSLNIGVKHLNTQITRRLSESKSSLLKAPKDSEGWVHLVCANCCVVP